MVSIFQRKTWPVKYGQFHSIAAFNMVAAIHFLPSTPVTGSVPRAAYKSQDGR